MGLWFLPSKCVYIEDCGRECYNIYGSVLEKCGPVKSAQEALARAKQSSCKIDYSKDVKVFRDQENKAYVVREDACDVWSFIAYENGTMSCRRYMC